MIPDLLKYAVLCKQSYSDIISYEYNNMKMIHNLGTDVLILQNEEEICFAFRGTDSLDSMSLNVSFFKTNFVINNERYGVVHCGFLKYYTHAKEQLHDILDEYLLKFPDGNVIFTGHSLGATAMFFALDVSITRSVRKEQLVLITFGSPRMGNSTFTNHIDTNIGKCIRVFNTSDPVVDILPLSCIYSHTGIVIIGIKDTYIWYSNIFTRFFDIRAIIRNSYISHSIDKYIELLTEQ
jgi:hypothetical protein